MRQRKKIGRFLVILAAITTGGFAAYATLRSHADAPPRPDGPLAATERHEAVEGAIAQLQEHYVFPDKIAAVAQALRDALQRGRFDTATRGAAFAEALTQFLRHATHDRHIEVRYDEEARTQSAGDAEQDDENAAAALQALRLNHGFASYRRLRGNIGYVELHSFGRPTPAAPRIAALMALLADTGALIIDLRRCGGGDPDTVLQFASYLYDRPTHLNDIYWRDEQRTELRWTSETVPGPRYGQSRNVFLLTSPDTFSGCEDLAYALKNNGRARLIGETTGGGAHAGSPQRISAHLRMFVPSGRPISPITGKDWEGVGVTPDVPVPADEALDVAYAAAVRAIIAVEADADWKRRLTELLDEIE